MIATATTIFWGAFLLFLVQPLTARRLLPWFGGSPAVWVVSLLFFQTILLLGYAYAHATGRCFDSRRQALVHAALVVGALLLLPIGPHAAVDSAGSDPTWGILAVLAASLGLPLLTLSATNPLMQRWLASGLDSDRRGRVYRFFALSNLGSLLGLWCYPFLLEPRTSIALQVRLWSYGYVLFAVATLLCAMTAYQVRAAPVAAVDPKGDASAKRDLPVRLLWLGLAATGSVMLMATSNQLTRNVAAVPFLWVLPLSLYLLTFIVAFEHDRWYVRPLWAVVFVGSLLGVLQLLGQDDEPDFVVQLVLYSLNLFSGAMVCHGELARLRPKTERLTAFYLYVALGGALGGAAVSVIAPKIFSGYWEYPLGLFAVYVLGGLAMPIAGRERIFWILGGAALGLMLASYVRSERVGVVDMRRSFFGVVRIYDRFPETELWERYLWNGPVAHGGQFLAPEKRRTPILYYGPQTGIGLALRHDPGRPRRVGVLGLGTGSVTLYGREGDRFLFYEINPDVVELAQNDFYYLNQTEADVEIEIGDGRLLLGRSENLDLDVLVLDAFTGDAIPVHLLTEEAFAIYERHLAADGILVVHVSNLHFDLKPVIRARAEAMGSVAVLVESDADDEKMLYASDWVLITTNGEFLSDPELQSRWTPWRADEAVALEEFLWTDDFTNLFRMLR